MADTIKISIPYSNGQQIADFPINNLQTWLPADADFEGGICVGSIQAKAGLTQSVVSSYLLMMQKAGLLESRRYGQWTYYCRNEKCIQEFSDYIRNEL